MRNNHLHIYHIIFSLKVCCICTEQPLPSRTREKHQAAQHALHRGQEEGTQPPRRRVGAARCLQDAASRGHADDARQRPRRVANAPADFRKAGGGGGAQKGVDWQREADETGKKRRRHHS